MNVGIAWYKREQYARILEVMVDTHLLPPTYNAWLKAAEKGVKSLQRQGHRPVRAYLDPDAFVSWCGALNIKPDADARMRFANDAAFRAATGDQNH